MIDQELVQEARGILMCDDEEFRSRAYRWYYNAIVGPVRPKKGEDIPHYMLAFAQAVTRAHRRPLHLEVPR